jgi:Holliday junction resolvase RusA-like endonuclease
MAKQKWSYKDLKAAETERVAWEMIRQGVRNIPQYTRPVTVTITWYCPNKRKDKDNVMAGCKFIFDAMQVVGLIKNDGWNQVAGIVPRFEVDPENPRVEVIIEEVER